MSWEDEAESAEQARQKRLRLMWGEPDPTTFKLRSQHYTTRGHKDEGKKVHCSGALGTLLQPNQLIAVPNFEDRQYDHVLQRFPSVYRLYRLLDARRRYELRQRAETRMREAQTQLTRITSATPGATSTEAAKLQSAVAKQQELIERMSHPAFLYMCNLQVCCIRIAPATESPCRIVVADSASRTRRLCPTA